MQYKTREPDQDTAALIGELEPVIGGLGFALVELNLFRGGKRTGTARVRLVVTLAGSTRPDQVSGQAADRAGQEENSAGIGTTELSRIHRTILPRLELALEGRDLYVEVSSPGTDRLIKDGAEFRHYRGRQIKCWRTGADDWERGELCGSDEEKILLKTGEGTKEMRYETIAKARLDG